MSTARPVTWSVRYGTGAMKYAAWRELGQYPDYAAAKAAALATRARLGAKVGFCFTPVLESIT